MSVAACVNVSVSLRGNILSVTTFEAAFVGRTLVGCSWFVLDWQDGGAEVAVGCTKEQSVN